MRCPIGKTCPSCGGSALDVTAGSEHAYRFICGSGCGYQWEEPFPKAADAMFRLADSAERATSSFERFAEVCREAE